MIKIYEDEISVCFESDNGGTITSLKKCPHGINVWNNGWDLSLCIKCNQPERSKREDFYKECEELGHMNTWMPKNQTLCMRCGALNTMETW